VLLGSANIAAVNQVEDLEENERVEDEGETSHLVFVLDS